VKVISTTMEAEKSQKTNSQVATTRNYHKPEEGRNAIDLATKGYYETTTPIDVQRYYLTSNTWVENRILNSLLRHCERNCSYNKKNKLITGGSAVFHRKFNGDSNVKASATKEIIAICLEESSNSMTLTSIPDYSLANSDVDYDEPCGARTWGVKNALAHHSLNLSPMSTCAQILVDYFIRGELIQAVLLRPESGKKLQVFRKAIKQSVNSNVTTYIRTLVDMFGDTSIELNTCAFFLTSDLSPAGTSVNSISVTTSSDRGPVCLSPDSVSSTWNGIKNINIASRKTITSKMKNKETTLSSSCTLTN